MHHAQRTHEVRRLVATTFADLGVAEPEQFRESILIRDGSYCGRRFVSDSATAIWFIEENEVKFYRADGRVARVVEPAPRDIALPAAA
ncbi:MAG: hypothetical protein SFU86_24495 [Pirellulaceae bacterium]|nr:hypothetical protein [Pirellulaceae bacterium]